MSLWARINGSILFDFPLENDESVIKRFLLMTKGSEKVFQGSEGSVTIQYIREKLSSSTYSSHDSFFKETSDHKEEERIKGIALQGNLRDWKVNMSEAEEIVGSTFNLIAERLGVRSAVLHISSDSGGNSVIFYDTEKGCSISMNDSDFNSFEKIEKVSSVNELFK